MKINWLSSNKMTVGVWVNDKGIIQAKNCPPIVKKFIGQNVNALIRWMQADKREELECPKQEP